MEANVFTLLIITQISLLLIQIFCNHSETNLRICVLNVFIAVSVTFII